jgi:hypothetical protein
MKKIALLFLAIMAVTACGSKTNSTQQVADSTVVKELPDTLNNAEAVTRQVDAVYSYRNELREHFDESQPTVDERFGTQEWRRVRQDVDAIDRECECGGFFDFGEDGPLDAWTYDCYEGTVSANDIQVKMQPDGTAEVRFLIKDASTPKGRPVRWLMRVENGEWRVANIFFENDDDYDLLMNMRAYADDGKYNKSFNINKYLPDYPDFRSRDQLCVTGMLAGEKVSVIVNHWPSRLGGEEASSYLREAAGRMARATIDSLLLDDPNQGIIFMGDLNDDPQNKSCSEALGAKKEIKDCVEPGSCFNPWWNILNKGIGTLGYKGNWNLFDQIIFSNYFLKNYDSKDKPTLTFSRAEVLNRKFLRSNEGDRQGYPMRTFSAGVFLNGYSDHFPTMIYLVKEIK